MKNYINKLLSVLLIGGSASVASAAAWHDSYDYLDEVISDQYGLVTDASKNLICRLIYRVTPNQEPVERDTIQYRDILNDNGYRDGTLHRLISRSLIETFFVFQLANTPNDIRDRLINDCISVLDINDPQVKTKRSRLERIKSLAETGNIKWENLKRLQETNLVMPTEQAFFEQLAQRSRLDYSGRQYKNEISQKIRKAKRQIVTERNPNRRAKLNKLILQQYS